MLTLKRLALIKSMEANQLADFLKVAPLYKQQENARWTSAYQTYQRCVSTDETGIGFDNFMDPSSLIPSTPPQQTAPVLARGRGSSGMLTPDGRPNGAAYSLPPSRAGGLSGMSSPRLNFPHAYGTLRGGSHAASPGEPQHNSLELEAVAAVHELSFAVNGIAVSDMLPRTADLIFVNVTTLEDQAYCLELTSKGWRVTSLRHDCMNGDFKMIQLHTRYFETVYALMDQISPGYRQKFSEALAAKLTELTQLQSEESSQFPEDDAEHLRPAIAVRHPSGEGTQQNFPSSPGGFA